VKRALAAALVAAGGGCEAAGAPSLDSITPGAAAGGAIVELRGTGFCATADCSDSAVGAVDFGVEIPQIRAAVVTWTVDRISVVVPQSVDPGPTEVLVTANDRSSNAIDFEVLP
jgi:uncharacterized protein (TIGR03437 family)